MEIETPIRTSLTANFAKYFCRVKINVIWLNWSWQSLDELGARVNNMLFDTCMGRAAEGLLVKRQ